MPYTGLQPGSRITAARLAQISGIWTPYAVAWTATTTNPAIGNGILEGKYALVGGLCVVRVNVAMGSSTTYGSGQYQFSLPFPAAALGHPDFHWVGTSTALDRAAAWYPGQCRVASGASVVMPISSTTATGGTTTEWNSGRPFTWGNTDILNLEVAYEPA
ncbi:hypothetical protein ACF09L_32585 [Streptomyces sp. NPDC014779]|uniref:hypothetical protein n=1 Tax=Streptomyces sp. NPDC014779 TaxID=3364911 RepID=UPI003701E401